MGFGARVKRGLRVESSIANTKEDAEFIIEAIGSDNIGEAIGVMRPVVIAWGPDDAPVE